MIYVQIIINSFGVWSQWWSLFSSISSASFAVYKPKEKAEEEGLQKFWRSMCDLDLILFRIIIFKNISLLSSSWNPQWWSNTTASSISFPAGGWILVLLEKYWLFFLKMISDPQWLICFPLILKNLKSYAFELNTSHMILLWCLWLYEQILKNTGSNKEPMPYPEFEVHMRKHM